MRAVMTIWNWKKWFRFCPIATSSSWGIYFLRTLRQQGHRGIAPAKLGTLGVGCQRGVTDNSRSTKNLLRPCLHHRHGYRPPNIYRCPTSQTKFRDRPRFCPYMIAVWAMPLHTIIPVGTLIRWRRLSPPCPPLSRSRRSHRHFMCPPCGWTELLSPFLRMVESKKKQRPRMVTVVTTVISYYE